MGTIPKELMGCLLFGLYIWNLRDDDPLAYSTT